MNTKRMFDLLGGIDPAYIEEADVIAAPQALPKREKGESAFSRFMSSPAAAAVLSGVAAVGVLFFIVRAGQGSGGQPAGSVHGEAGMETVNEAVVGIGTDGTLPETESLVEALTGADGTPTETESVFEWTTEVNAYDPFADVDTEGHTLKKTADGVYCIKPKVTPQDDGGTSSLISVFCFDIQELRGKLLHGGFTEKEYRIMNSWPQTADGAVIPNPNRMRDVIHPNHCSVTRLILTGRVYTWSITSEARMMEAFISIIPEDEFNTEYETAKQNACSAGTALTQADGTQTEGFFNDIPCTIYEYTSPETGMTSRGYWIDLSTDTDERYVSVVLPDAPDFPVSMTQVGRTNNGVTYTISFIGSADPDILKTYTADFFRVFRFTN